MSSEAEGTGEAIEVKYASRAVVKLTRAGQLFQSLEHSVDQWNEEHQVMAPARSPHDGSQRIEFFRPDVIGRIPLADWESTFHDGVHNLRVALDALCFELCHLEQPASEPGSIHFPITGHPNEWPGRIKHLGTIPPPLLERLRQCQPWERLDRQSPDPLKLISKIDNVDKHRATGVTFDVMPLGQWELRPSAPVPRELSDSQEWPLDPWISLTLDPPVERGWAALVPVMIVPIVFFEGLFASLPDAQRWMHNEVHRVIEFIASGHWPEAQSNRFLPGPIWSVFPEPEPTSDRADS